MDNIDRIKVVLESGKLKNHLQLFTFTYENYLLDISYENDKIRNATVYSKDMKFKGWLTEEECKKLEPFFTRYVTKTQDFYC